MHFTSRSCLNFSIKKWSPPPNVMSSDLRFGCCGVFFFILHGIFFPQYSSTLLSQYRRCEAILLPIKLDELIPRICEDTFVSFFQRTKHIAAYIKILGSAANIKGKFSSFMAVRNISEVSLEAPTIGGSSTSSIILATIFA